MLALFDLYLIWIWMFAFQDSLEQLTIYTRAREIYEKTVQASFPFAKPKLHY